MGSTPSPYAHIGCKDCPCNANEIVTRPKPAKIAVVVDAPSEQEVKADTWFYGKRGGASQLLRAILSEFIDPDEVYVTSAVNCRPNPKKKAMQRKAMEACRSRLMAELEAVGAKKVLCVGPMGWGAITGQKKLPAPTTSRGRWKEVNGMQVMATLPPGFAISQVEYFRDIWFDVSKFFNTDKAEPYPDVWYWKPETVFEAKEAFDFLESHPFVSCDLETEGFSARKHDIIACGLGVLDGKKGTIVVLDEELLNSRTVWRRLEKLINGPLDLVFHNAKFDLQFFERILPEWGLTYDPHNIQDTMLLHYALDERPMGKFKSHGLEKIASCRYDAPDYGIDMEQFLIMWADSQAQENWDRIDALRRTLHLYLCLDVYYTARLFPDLWNECLEEDERLLDVYETLYMPGSIALASVENYGILIDRPMFEKSRAVIKKKENKLLKNIRKACGIADFNPGSPKQVKEYVYGTLGLTVEAGMAAAVAQIADISSRKEGIRSRGTYTDPARLKDSPTAAPVLRMLARGHPDHAQFLEDICEWRNYAKNAGTYLDGMLRRIDVDGRLHGTINIHGTASGRLSSTNPNLQNVPPASHTGIAIRSGLMAGPGRSIIDGDYKQLEVRVAAELSEDPVMLELFESGGDPHAETSHIIYGREDVSHYERMLGKIITFGLLYGRSPDSVATGPEAEDIVARGGKRWAPADVREFFGNLLSRWKVYATWRQTCREKPYQDGEITFSVGRKRRFDFIPKHDGGHCGRQGINTPCQGTASDFCLYAVIRLHEVLKPYDAQVILTVHDSILVDCADECLDEVLELMEQTMVEDTLWETKVPLAVDIKVSQRWGQEDDEQYGGTSIDQEAAAV